MGGRQGLAGYSRSLSLTYAQEEDIQGNGGAGKIMFAFNRLLWLLAGEEWTDEADRVHREGQVGG